MRSDRTITVHPFWYKTQGGNRTETEPTIIYIYIKLSNVCSFYRKTKGKADRRGKTKRERHGESNVRERENEIYIKMNRYVLKSNSFNSPIPLHQIPRNWEPTSKNHPSSKPSSYFLLISSIFRLFFFFYNHCISPVSSSVFIQVLVFWASLSSKVPKSDLFIHVNIAFYVCCLYDLVCFGFFLNGLIFSYF